MKAFATLGRPGWEVWYTAAAETAMERASVEFPGVPEAPRARLAGLRDLMNHRAPPDGTKKAGRSPAPVEVIETTTAVLAELDAWLAAVQTAEDSTPNARLPSDLPRCIVQALSDHALSGPDRALQNHDWDFLASHYLGCAAMYHASGGARENPAWAKSMTPLTTDLQFPRRAWERADSPAGFDRLKRERVRENFGQLLDASGPPGVRR